MQKKFITIARENKNADFYLVCHTACNELGNFQWFLKDAPNSEHEVNLENQVYESFSTDSNWIKENAEKKEFKEVLTTWNKLDTEYLKLYNEEY